MMYKEVNYFVGLSLKSTGEHFLLDHLKIRKYTISCVVFTKVFLTAETDTDTDRKCCKNILQLNENFMGKSIIIMNQQVACNAITRKIKICVDFYCKNSTWDTGSFEIIFICIVSHQ